MYYCWMNIFILDENPTLAAQYQCNKHVVKMVTETEKSHLFEFKNRSVPDWIIAEVIA